MAFGSLQHRLHKSKAYGRATLLKGLACSLGTFIEYKAGLVNY